MAIDLKKLIDSGKKALRVKSEIERLEKADKRIYELSRMVPDEEGYELLSLYKQSIKDTVKVQKVIHEK